MGKSKVYLVSAEDRAVGARRCLAYFGVPDYAGKTVFVKPNFNNADPPPGSTHNDVLEALFGAVRATNPKKIVLGERSGPAVVAEVFEKKGIGKLTIKYGVEFLNLEELPEEEWAEVGRAGLHWPKGLKVPRAVLEADAVVATCCLKAHGFGGVFSNALKLGIGLTPKDFNMLHGSPHMRKMIAEVNVAYTPDFVLVDAVEVFLDGGPMVGERCAANLMLIGSDRVALDAVGLAILKTLGANSAIMNTPIFEQEQIARAVELGLGARSAAEIEIVTDDEKSAAAADPIREMLL